MNCPGEVLINAGSVEVVEEERVVLGAEHHSLFDLYFALVGRVRAYQKGRRMSFIYGA